MYIRDMCVHVCIHVFVHVYGGLPPARFYPQRPRELHITLTSITLVTITIALITDILISIVLLTLINTVMITIITIMIHPVSITIFPSFRTQPLENITPLPMNK